MSPDVQSAASRDRRGEALKLACFAVAVTYVIVLAGCSIYGTWLFTEVRAQRLTDFAAFWGGGRLALSGEAVSAYDVGRHADTVRAAAGSAGSVPRWVNPPSFLILVTPFAWLDYPFAKLAWALATFAGFALVMRRICPHPAALMAAAAFPAVLSNVYAGQNGLLTAALLGGALVSLTSRPAVAGLCLGVLTVKPQLGILIPLALMAGGHWRVAAFATVTAIALVALSALLFGVDSWSAFIQSLPRTGELILQNGWTGWGKVQSVYGVLSHLGFGGGTAWTAQAIVGCGVAAGVCSLWAGRGPFELKAAALATGALLVQPYVFLYDGAVLGIAIAFLVRLGLRSGFARYEPAGIAAACLCLLLGNVIVVNLGFAAALIVATLVIGRVLAVARAGRAVGSGRAMFVPSPAPCPAEAGRD